MSKFPISDDSMVVTTSYVTADKLPILEVSHDDDEEGRSLWQFHCGNGDYSPDRLQLVRLSTILGMDPSVSQVSGLKMGQQAIRSDTHDAWKVQ